MKGKKDPKSHDRYMVPAIKQAAEVLFCLAESEASHMSLTEICAKVGIHSGRAFSILHSLQKFGLTQRNIGRKGYSLGPGLITLSRKVLDSFDAPRLAQPVLENLAKKSDSTATLGYIADDQLIVIAKYEGEKDVGLTVRIGRHFPFTHGAEGKAIAAFLPEKQLKELLKRKNLLFHGTPEKLERKRLADEFEKCRRLGYALDLGEMNPNFNAVAAPVFGPSGYPIGYINVIGILSASWAQELGPLVADAGRELSRQLGAVVV
jgi:DNA-binding IclR family transcriptional regulator